MAVTESDVEPLLWDVKRFAEEGSGITLRKYQVEVAQAIVDSVMHNRGDTIVVMFPRQSVGEWLDRILQWQDAGRTAC